MSSFPASEPPRPREGDDFVALVVGPSATEAWGAPARRRVAVLGAGVSGRVVDVAEAPALVAELERRRPRWVWWSAGGVAPLLARAGNRPARAWDISQAHRLLHGGWEAWPGLAWAVAHGLPVDSVPPPPRDDLLGALGAEPENPRSPVRADGHLEPAAAAQTWALDDELLFMWAQTTLECARAQRRRAQETWPRLVATVHAESAAAVLCVELEHDGLPVDRAALMEVIGPLSGPTATVDAPVLSLVPGHEHTDLRNPAQVKGLLHALGINVPDTRKWTLDAYREAHPVVPALLEWRAAERIRTTYGLRWLEEHAGPDDRLRGRWHTCDGGAGRMTAEAGLHSIPAVLRPGVAAHPGHVLVRADLGQVEPRVLAAVSGDRPMAAATGADDLYLGLARQLGSDRDTAKIAMLAAMYGQRSGPAAEALRGLERAYPTAMRVLDQAQRAGVEGGDMRTFGGRLIPTGRLSPGRWSAANPGSAEQVAGGRAPGSGRGASANRTAAPELSAEQQRSLAAARGRFARNAIIQGAAAELFKAWAATVRATTAGMGAQIVMCLHDELLVHVPEEHGQEAARAVDQALTDAARRWSGGAPVRFVADTQVIRRWSEAT